MSNTIILPANTIQCINVGLMLVQRRRRWTNIKPTLDQRLVFAGRPTCDSRESLVN